MTESIDFRDGNNFVSSSETDLKQMLDEVVDLANRQYESAPFKRLLSLKFSRERAQQYSIQMAYYVKNRRDCWAYVQGSAPLEVKRVIWEHESDELINDPRAGMDHYSLTVKQGEVIGLTPEDFERAEITPMVRSCFFMPGTTLLFGVIGSRLPPPPICSSAETMEKSSRAAGCLFASAKNLRTSWASI
jgi:hypothetical protein